MIVGKKIILEGVTEKDIEQLRIWRNEPKLRKYFREYREINDKMQENWFSKITVSFGDNLWENNCAIVAKVL